MQSTREIAAALIVQKLRSNQNWHPQDGPQSAAYNSDADIIGYGGAAGGGKTDLGLGLAFNKHYRSVIFRRTYPLLEGIEARGKEIFGNDKYNGSLHRWLWDDGKSIRLASLQYEDDKKNFQGRPFDLYVFDEATEFLESQVRFVIGWNRSAKENQKCQVLLPFNPPMDEAGEWITKFFAAWLDNTHSNPAQDGELRWYARIDDEDIEMPDNKPIEHNGEWITPRSRTFFHAKLSDNPILERTGYQSTIDAMPEPIRSILKGKFGAYKLVDPFQLIRPDWVKAANERWNKSKPSEVITAIGADIARGGIDKMVIASLRQDRFDELKKYPGVSVPDGKTAALLIEEALPKDNGVSLPAIGVDVIGIGASAYDHLIVDKPFVQGINFGAGSDETDKSGKYKFANVRAEAYWKFREALDPDYNSTMALPIDSELLGDLCAPKWEVRTGRLYIESKDEIKKRLGRSTDCADAIVLAWYASHHPIQIF